MCDVKDKVYFSQHKKPLHFEEFYANTNKLKYG